MAGEKKKYDPPRLTPCGDVDGKLSEGELDEVSGGYYHACQSGGMASGSRCGTGNYAATQCNIGMFTTESCAYGNDVH